MNFAVGTKVTWKEGDKLVQAYIVEIREDFVVVKVHGQKGRWQIPKKSLVDSIMAAAQKKV